MQEGPARELPPMCSVQEEVAAPTPKEEEDVKEELQAVISNAEGGVQQSTQLPFVRLVLMWNACLGLVGGSLIAVLERGRQGKWLDFVFVAINSTTATGLTSVDIPKLRAASLVVMAVLMQLGGATVVSLAPVILRIRALRRALPREDGAVTFDLRKYRLVPEWLVQYKALCFLLRIVIFYHVVVYLVYGGLLAVLIATTPAARRASREAVVTTPVAWATFHSISAFNNVGFTLQHNGFESLSDQPAVLFATGMLVLHGNVLYPACIRWIIVALSARSPRESNRKVYFRYLLLHGRKLYSSLFSSQATWMLVATQLALVSLQIAVTLALSRHDRGFRGQSAAARLDVAAFLALNTRHAGIAPVDLRALHGGTLVMQMAMMWLAPVPHVAALRSTHLAVPPPQEQGDADEDERRRRHNSGRRITLSLGDARHSGDVVPDLAHLQQGAAPPDALVDTRALLLERYPDRSPPWRERVSSRFEAFVYHCHIAATTAYRSSGFVRDASLIFAAWFAIACCEDYKRTESCDNPHQVSRGLFHASFELASAFGNVGLSLGSVEHPAANVSYAADLSSAAMLVLVAVMLGGRARDMPRRVDAALTLPTLSTQDLLRAAIVDLHRDNPTLAQPLQSDQSVV